jgi:hypothetical protein
MREGFMAAFEAEMPHEHATCLLAWSEWLYEAFRCRRMASDLARTLDDLGLAKAATTATRTTNYLEEDLVTGEMLEVMRRKFEQMYPVINDPVCSALIKQFTGIKVKELFASIDDRRCDYLGEMANRYIHAARVALNKKEELPV